MKCHTFCAHVGIGEGANQSNQQFQIYRVKLQQYEKDEDDLMCVYCQSSIYLRGIDLRLLITRWFIFKRNLLCNVIYYDMPCYTL